MAIVCYYLVCVIHYEVEGRYFTVQDRRTFSVDPDGIREAKRNKENIENSLKSFSANYFSTLAYLGINPCAKNFRIEVVKLRGIE